MRYVEVGKYKCMTSVSEALQASYRNSVYLEKEGWIREKGEKNHNARWLEVVVLMK
jgi:hypothetical protein